MIREIKQCPFCGNDGLLTQNYSYKTGVYFVHVKCSYCNGQGRAFSSKEEPAECDWGNKACNNAVLAWNERHL